MAGEHSWKLLHLFFLREITSNDFSSQNSTAGYQPWSSEHISELLTLHIYTGRWSSLYSLNSTVKSVDLQQVGAGEFSWGAQNQKAETCIELEYSTTGSNWFLIMFLVCSNFLTLVTFVVNLDVFSQDG